jgi:hypothetical protein
MGLRNYYFKNIDMRLSDSDYWDMYISSDETYSEGWGGIIDDTSLVAYFDFNDSNIFNTGNTNIYSLTTWTGATACASGTTGQTLVDIGLTGIDNGLITYIKPSGDTENNALLSALTGSSLVILSSDTQFWMHEVTGMTNTYIYPIDLLSADTIGQYAQLCGGFYQGFYKLHDYDYQTLPNRMHKGWVAEFWLNKSDVCSGYTGTTLNDDFPDNEGFFFYIGARAENKFWNVWSGQNEIASGCTTGCTEWCTILKENEMTTSSGIPLDPPQLFIRDIDNQFLILSRSRDNGDRCGCGNGADDDGLPHNITTCNYTGGSITITSSTVYDDAENQFLVYNRVHGSSSGSCGSCGGHGDGTGFTTCNYTGRTHQNMELNWSGDVVYNATGFRIREDGSIGYRRLIYTCTTEAVTAATIEESYSAAGLVSDDEWTHVAVRWVADTTYDECQLLYSPPRTGKLMFYINGKLKFIVRDFIEIVSRELDEHKEKQQTVPFNMSIGGGSQGLLESQTFDGPDPEDFALLIEQYFAGTFIGGISKFRFYDEELSWCGIKNNYEDEATTYGHSINCPCQCSADLINLGMYYGKFNIATITGAEAAGLAHIETTNVIGSTFSFLATLGYCYFIIPSTFTQPTAFYDANNLLAPIPHVTLADVITGGVTYNVYRTFFATNAAINIKII